MTQTSREASTGVIQLPDQLLTAMRQLCGCGVRGAAERSLCSIGYHANRVGGKGNKPGPSTAPAGLMVALHAVSSATRHSKLLTGTLLPICQACTSSAHFYQQPDRLVEGSTAKGSTIPPRCTEG